MKVTGGRAVPAHGRDPILRMEKITKRFGPVLANDQIDLVVREGSVHGLLGENGAGKTTLVNILYGLYQPDAGRMLLRGRQVRFTSPRSAIRQGIGMIHQQFMLVPPLTVAENIILGLPPRRSAFLDLRRVEAEIRTLSKTYRLDVDPRAPIWQLPVGIQQRVEILKALYRQADLFILDEPTSVLTPAESEALFEIVKRLVSEGRSVIFITHKLDEVMHVCNEVTVLRQGRVVATLPTTETTPAALARMMVGRDVVLRLEKGPARRNGVVLQIDGLRASNDRSLPALKGVSFAVQQGEVFGIAGVDGNGQTELAEVVSGLRRATAGRIMLRGVDVTNAPVRRRISQGLAYIPSDRHRFGVIPDLTVADNLVLKDFYHPPFAYRAILQPGTIRQHAAALAKRFDIRMAGIEQEVRQLSGGNQQKVVLAREVSGDPHLIVAMQPTRGLDVGASEFVLRTILAQRDRGAAVLYTSAELDEVLAVSDRVAVMFDGEIMGIVRPNEVSLEEVSLMMGGALRKPLLPPTEVNE